MSLNPSRTVRAILYVLTAVGTPVVAYLNAKGILGSLEVSFWSAEVAVVSGLAALNTTDRTEATVAVNAPADVDVTLEANDPVRQVAMRKVDETDDVQW